MKNSKNTNTQLSKFEYIGFTSVGVLLVMVIVGFIVR